MVARDIKHEQATELVKGHETLVDQCRRCRTSWPCEVKVLQEENAALRRQLTRVSPDLLAVADAVGDADDPASDDEGGQD